MDIVVISDTHSQHTSLSIPIGDMIIHCGDITQYGSKKETENFLQWFKSLPHKNKIFIAGNHDYYIQENIDLIKNTKYKNMYFLHNTGVIIDGIYIRGSPYTPTYKNMAFNKKRSELKQHWNMIPKNIDILVTHGPPKNILDTNINKENVGCKHLQEKVGELNPSFHLFGHIHESSGKVKVNETTFINASMTDKSKKINNTPWKVSLRK